MLRIDTEEIDRLKVTHDVHHSWLKATPPLPPVMVMVMMMAVVTVVGSIELLYPSHHLAPHVTQMWRFKITQALLFLWDRILVGQSSCGTEFFSCVHLWGSFLWDRILVQQTSVHCARIFQKYISSNLLGARAQKRLHRPTADHHMGPVSDPSEG